MGESPMMLRILACAAALALTAPAAAFAGQRGEAKAHVEFGIKVAQNGLWKEAIYRWERAVEIDPEYAQAWNNLGIGYEQDGRFDEALAAYEKALKLDPKNQMIRTNYDQFKEIHERTNRRGNR